MSNVKRDKIIKNHYPFKLTVEEFADEIKANIDKYVKNLQCIRQDFLYAEEWMDMFARWMEMK